MRMAIHADERLQAAYKVLASTSYAVHAGPVLLPVQDLIQSIEASFCSLAKRCFEIYRWTARDSSKPTSCP